MGTEPLLIVLAEDDDGHASLVQRNLERAGLANGLQRLKDGQEALDFVRGEGAFEGRNTSQQPVLLLLDIKMPRADGIEVLRQIKGDPRTALIPVIMLTTTDDPREIHAATSWVAASTSPSPWTTRASSRPSSGWGCSSRWCAARQRPEAS